MKVRNLRDITTDIDEKREEMIQTAQKYGYLHESTIKSSQDLDELINEYLLCTRRQENRKKAFFNMAKGYCFRLLEKRFKISM